MRRTSLNDLKDALLELDPSLKGTEEDASFKTALVLLAALACGPDATQLAQFTELPLQFVVTIRQRMIEAELWTELDVCCEHWFLSDYVCPTSFWPDVLVAEGLLVRHWVEGEGNYRYWCKEYAPEAACQSVVH